jgi:hypothetical protein
MRQRIPPRVEAGAVIHYTQAFEAYHSRLVSATCRDFFPNPREGSHVFLVKSLWASVQGDPVFMRRVNGWLAIFFIAMIPVSWALGWLHSVAYVSALSLWALVSGHWSAWQAARVEVEQERVLVRERRRPVEERVVDELVETTDVEPAVDDA